MTPLTIFLLISFIVVSIVLGLTISGTVKIPGVCPICKDCPACQPCPECKKDDSTTQAGYPF